MIRRTSPRAGRKLDTSGKLLERFLKPRLTAAIENGDGWPAKQYGFRSGRSTIGASRELTEAAIEAQGGSSATALDVKNAFNCLKWSDVLIALEYNFSAPHYILAMISSHLNNI